MSHDLQLDHVCRIEGHAGIRVKMMKEKYFEAFFDVTEGPRFYEALVRGRSYADVPQILSRVCSICSGAHTISSLMAIEDAFGIRVSPQTKLLRELLILGGNIQSHALHVYFLSLPDFFNLPDALSLKADHPDVLQDGLALKKIGNDIQEVLGGRAIHPVNPIPGGFGTLPTLDQLVTMKESLRRAMDISRSLIDVISTIEIPDVCESPSIFASLNTEDGYSLFGETIVTSTRKMIPVSEYTRLTNETIENHSTAKHSRFLGKPYAVGALARLNINGYKLSDAATGLLHKAKLFLPCQNILHNNTAQAIELVYSCKRAMEIIDILTKEGLKKERPVAVIPKKGTGVGAIEAPRGTLYHSYTFDDRGMVLSADVITPTAQNCANVEKDLKSAVKNSRSNSEGALVQKLEMIVRAYDPCISCSVH